MRVRCIDSRPYLKFVDGRFRVEAQEGSTISLAKGKIYEVIAVERGWYRIVDETEEDYLYPPDRFEVVED
jgi:hypothetical protein